MSDLNLQQRFLYLFADYRQAIEDSQRHGDELITLRSANADLAAKLAEGQETSLKRERELADRSMRLLHGDRVFGPVSTSNPPPQADPAAQVQSPKDWQQQKEAEFRQALKARQAMLSSLNGPIPSPKN